MTAPRQRHLWEAGTGRDDGGSSSKTNDGRVLVGCGVPFLVGDVVRVTGRDDGGNVGDTMTGRDDGGSPILEGAFMGSSPTSVGSFVGRGVPFLVGDVVRVAGRDDGGNVGDTMTGRDDGGSPIVEGAFMGSSSTSVGAFVGRGVPFIVGEVVANAGRDEGAFVGCDVPLIVGAAVGGTVISLPPLLFPPSLVMTGMKRINPSGSSG